MQDLTNGVIAKNDEEVYIMIYINNGAVNKDADPSATLARNVSVATQTDTSPGSVHYVNVTVSGDNIETIYGKVRINTNPNERIEVIPKSGQVRNYTMDVIRAEDLIWETTH